MAVSLVKGGNVNLSKEDPTLVNVVVGLGWKPRATDGESFDLDASAYLLSGDKVRSDADFVFYNNKVSAEDSVISDGDNRTGQGDGDDEVIHVTLSKVPTDVSRIVFAASIHEGAERKQNFGQVGDAYIRIINKDTGVEITRYDLDEDASMDTSVVFGELYRYEDGWKFKALGNGSKQSLLELSANYGVNVG